jgi:hypothetical protein
MKRLIAFVGAATLCSAAFAQSRSSFWDVDGFSDVFLTISNGGLTYELTMGANPKMTFEGVTYDIQDIFGVWALSNDDDLVASMSNTGVWEAHQNQSGTGGIAGWKTNPNTGLYANQSYSWTFDSLNVASVEQQGFHVRCFGEVPRFGGNTGYATVPEPSSLAALGALGALFLARRRK